MNESRARCSSLRLQLKVLSVLCALSHPRTPHDSEPPTSLLPNITRSISTFVLMQRLYGDLHCHRCVPHKRARRCRSWLQGCSRTQSYFALQSGVALSIHGHLVPARTCPFSTQLRFPIILRLHARQHLSPQPNSIACGAFKCTLHWDPECTTLIPTERSLW